MKKLWPRKKLWKREFRRNICNLQGSKMKAMMGLLLL